jgi:hypothetical protein
MNGKSRWGALATVLGAIAALITALVGVAQLRGEDSPESQISGSGPVSGAVNSTGTARSAGSTRTAKAEAKEGIYSGSVEGKPGLSFTVNDGEVSGIKTPLAVRCRHRQTGAEATGEQMFDALPSTRGSIDDQGRLLIDVHLPSQVFRMSATFSGEKARGTMSWVLTVDDAGQLAPSDAAIVDCQTGELRWSAAV